ncbi:MAG: elongation factor P [Lentisphaerae bacterium]|nr:elongation factor P [Lentisphaerota bacterium]
MSYTSSDLRKGLKIIFEGQPYTVTEFQFTKPGKGQSIYSCRLKHLITNNTFVKNFRENDTFEKPDLETKTMRFSYEDGENYIFLDENYEQAAVSEEMLGERKFFLVDDIECEILYLDGQPIDIELPNFIERKVIQAEPGARGNTASGRVTKPVVVEGGYELQVPIFVEDGDWIRIDTRSGEYSDRIMGHR